MLASLFFTIVAVAITAALCTTEDLVQAPWQRLTLAIAGNVAATFALIFGAVVLFDRRRGWPVALFVGAVSLGVFWFLVPQLHQPVRDIVGQVHQSLEDGVSQARQAIPQKDATTAKVQPLLIAWGEEAMVQPYEAHGHHDAKWDDLARQFIRGMALELAGGYPRPGLERLRPLIVELKRTGCDDPWVLFLIRRLNSNDPDFGDAMRKAAADLVAAGYSSFSLWLARAEVVRAEREEGASPGGKLDTAPCKEALRAALSVKPLEQGALEAWLNIFDMEPGSSLLKQDAPGVCALVESVPSMPAWFPPAVRGRAEIELAWETRGSGWANSVSPEQWRQFGEHLQQARAALERSCKLAPNEPEPASALITVELGSTGIKEMRRRFDAVLASRFDYIPAYDAFRNGLQPRWFGSEEAVISFGRNCLATQRFDTAVPWQMLRAVYNVANDQNNPGDYYARQAPWKDLDAMFEGYLAHGNPDRRNYYLSSRLVMVARAGMDSEVDKLLKQLNYEVDPQVKADWNLSLYYVGRMAALSGPAADLVLAGQRLTDKQPAQALQKMLAAQKMTGLPPAAAEYITREVDELKAIVALGQSKWQPLIPPENLSGWKVGSGRWRVVSPTILEVATEDSGAMLIRIAPAGDTWEMRGELVLETEEPGRVEAAIFCGPADDQLQHGFSLRFWRRANQSSGISLARGFGDDAVSKTLDFEQKVPFFIRLENRHLRVRVGDDQWFAGQPLPEGATPDAGALLSLGSTGGGKQVLQFRKLEWRGPGPTPQ